MPKQLPLAYFKKKLLSVIILLLPIVTFTQNIIYTEEYNQNTYLKSKKVPYNVTCAVYYNNFVYALSSFSAINGKELAIYKFDKLTNKTTFITIKKNKDTEELFEKSVNSFQLCTNNLIILTGFKIFIFEFSNSEYKLLKVLKNDKGFSKILTLNDKEFLLYCNYNYHPLDVLDKHSWAKLNLETTTISDFTVMGDENVLFSYFVNSWISTYKGLIAYSHTSDYSIRFYNSQIKLVDSLKSELFNNNKKFLHLLPRGDDYSADEMYKIRDADDTLLSRIEKIFLLDSTRILVTVKLPKLKYMRYDIWSKRSGTWQISKTDTLPCYYQKGMAYTPQNNAVSGFYGGMDGLCYGTNNEFYFFYYPFKENVITDSYDPKKDYDDKINEMARKKELYYGIKKLKILNDK